MLLDAPCSGEGRFRLRMREREQEKMHDFNLRSSVRMSGYQRQMIVKGFDLLREGGVLVYSTCTYSPIENEGVIDHLLSERADAVSEPVVLNGIEGCAGITHYGSVTFAPSVSNAVRLYPHYVDSWGFFIARIRKRELPFH